MPEEIDPDFVPPPVKRSVIWLARALIGAVFTWNVWCALVFIFTPASYAPGFELDGPVGLAMMRSVGVLFLMWNVPYAVACWHPIRHRLAVWEAVIMQTIGVLGETLILWGLPAGHAILSGSLQRFILFDAIGLGLLLAALWLRPR